VVSYAPAPPAVLSFRKSCAQMSPFLPAVATSGHGAFPFAEPGRNASAVAPP
jgi:hypothetical protein